MEIERSEHVENSWDADVKGYPHGKAMRGRVLASYDFAIGVITDCERL